MISPVVLIIVFLISCFLTPFLFVKGRRTDFPSLLSSLGWVLLFPQIQILSFVLAVAGKVAVDPNFAQSMQLDQVTAMKSQSFSVLTLWTLLVSGLLTLALLFFRLRKDGRAMQIGLFESSRLGLAQTVGLGVLLMAGAILLTNFYGKYVIDGAKMQKVMEEFLLSLPHDPLHVTVKYLTVTVMAAVTEEIIFRGYLQNSLMKHMNSNAAIWLAAFVFSLVHFQPLAIPALMILGAAFGYLYHRTGSLKTNIALHMLNNAAALYFS